MKNYIYVCRYGCGTGVVHFLTGQFKKNQKYQNEKIPCADWLMRNIKSEIKFLDFSKITV